MTKSSNHSGKTFSPQVQKQLEDILLRVANFKAEADAILQKYRPPPSLKEATQILEYLFTRFHSVVNHLKERKRGRKPFIVKDEYDVQYLLQGLFRMYFEDIREEEWCPSLGGTSARIDFFLDAEHIAIEAKMASKSHSRKKILDELILDKEHYRKKKEIQTLYCMVYDPDGRIRNPRGFEKDLYEKRDGFEARVFVIPR